MCSASTFDCQYDNIINKNVGECIVRIHCVRVNLACIKRFFNLFKKWLSVSSMQVHVSSAQNFVFRTNNFVYLEVRTRDLNFWRDEKKFKMTLKMWIVQHVQTKVVFTFQSTNVLAFTTVKSAKPALGCRIIILRTKFWQLSCLVLMVLNALQRRRRVLSTKNKVHLHFWRNFSTIHNQAHTNFYQKEQKSFHLWHNRVDYSLVEPVNQKLIFVPNFYTFGLQLNRMIYSLSKDSIKRSLDFGPDSITVTVKDLVQEVKIRCQKLPLAA